MAHHDFINQAAVAIKEGRSTLNIVRRAFESGMDIMEVEALLETAKEIAEA